jgi:hypothetical protein
LGWRYTCFCGTDYAERRDSEKLEIPNGNCDCHSGLRFVDTERTSLMHQVWSDLFMLAFVVIVLVILLRDNQQANALMSGASGTYADTVTKLASLG